MKTQYTDTQLQEFTKISLCILAYDYYPSVYKKLTAETTKEQLIAWLLKIQANRIDTLEDSSIKPDIIKGVIHPSMNQYDKLLRWLNKLNDNEFRNMIRTLLAVEQQHTLPLPLDRIDRGSFLGDMQVHEGLDDVEHYLCKKYPNRFPC